MLRAFAFVLAILLSVLLPPADGFWWSRRKSSSSKDSTFTGDCDNPSGTECGWYRHCLEAEIPCKESSGPKYAIDYAEKFCNRYMDNYDHFSSKGQEWVDAVKKCLQLSMVKVLNASPTPSCTAIKEKGFRSHVPCYVNPGGGAPSFCDLSLMDKFIVVKTIIPAFKSDLVQTVKKGLKTLTHCLF